MAKKVHSYSFKGDYYHEGQIIAEYNSKTEETSYYRLQDILKEFDQKLISIIIEEEDNIPSSDRPFN